MTTETRIRFEDGGVTITQTVERDDEQILTTLSKSKPAEDEMELGNSLEDGPEAGPLRSPTVSKFVPRTLKGGEFGSTGTGGGGILGLGGGITLVFGSVTINNAGGRGGRGGAGGEVGPTGTGGF
jgi:hypothetical protein